MKRVFAMALLLALLAGCGGNKQDESWRGEQPPAVMTEESADLMRGVQARPLAANHEAAEPEALTDFGLALFQRCFASGGGNTLVSPLSVLEALAMAANGAAGDTRRQMESAFGADMDTINATLRAYVQGLADGEGGSVHIANGIWLNADGGFTVEPGFLQTNADYYGAGVYERPFDEAMAMEVNGWVAEHTAGRIDGILDGAPEEAAAVLVNALSFDGVWEDIYREDQVREDGTFTAAGGQVRKGPFLWSTERTFLRDGDAVGFLKYYEGRDYAFAALLPPENVTLEEYVASLTGARLRAALENADEGAYVNAAIPKFAGSYGAELQDILADMGLSDAFDPGKADFSRLGRSDSGPLYLSRVAHKTFINVDEKGTQAGAATAVEIEAAGLLGPEEQVCLDRPFLYMLVDCEHHAPLFIGAVTDIAVG